MKKIILIPILVILTSCGMTDQELYEKNKECEKLWMVAFRTLNWEWGCTYNTIYIK